MFPQVGRGTLGQGPGRENSLADCGLPNDRREADALLERVLDGVKQIGKSR